MNRWEDMSVVRKLVYSAYPIHVGSIFGPATKVLALLVCAGIAMLSVTGLVMWRLRRPDGKSRRAQTRERRRPAIAVIAAICGMGVVFPVLGASLILVVVSDQLVRWAKEWVWIGNLHRLRRS